jgi:hypothetical protein
MSYMALIPMTMNCNVHSMPLERMNNLQVRQERGGYEHGGGSSQQQGGLLGRLRRSSSQRVKSTTVQTRIDTGPWSTKSKEAKTAIGKALVKVFHTKAIPGVKVDNRYFMVTVKETQRCGKQILLSFIVLCTHFSLRH